MGDFQLRGFPFSMLNVTMKNINNYIPDAKADLDRFIGFVKSRKPFTFVRFSDGEVEILRNRKLEIINGKTLFRGSVSRNNYPVYDTKTFDPGQDSALRTDLIASATIRSANYYLGVPAKHNNAICDRDYIVDINGGMSKQITFSDLLMNSNYKRYRQELVPEFSNVPDLFLIANFRARPVDSLKDAKVVPVGDNFFREYETTIQNVIAMLKEIPANSMVLSSASSLSNIVGAMLYKLRPDITFIDIGTSLNDLLGLQSRTRLYHRSFFTINPIMLLKYLKYRLSGQHKIIW